jgi:aryl-alcohol dehydrogenase-like predicted oxidoreductase
LLLITQPVQMTLVSIGLEGKLIGAWVGETRQIVATTSASNRVCLNLQRLTFADSRGIELLRTLRREGIPLLGCSPLIEGLLAANEASANAIPSSTARAPDDKDPKCP